MGEIAVAELADQGFAFFAPGHEGGIGDTGQEHAIRLVEEGAASHWCGFLFGDQGVAFQIEMEFDAGVEIPYEVALAGGNDDDAGAGVNAKLTTEESESLTTEVAHALLLSSRELADGWEESGRGGKGRAPESLFTGAG